MDQRDVIQELASWAGVAPEAEAFDEDVVAEVQPRLYQHAVEAFGSWSIALGAALMHVTQESAKARRRATEPEEEVAAPTHLQAPATRQVTEAAGYPLYLLSDEGFLTRMALSQLEMTSASTWELLPDGPQRAAWPARLHLGDDDDTFFALSADGTGGTLHGPYFAHWGPDARPTRLVDRIRGAEDYPAVAMVPRRHLRLFHRIYAVATDGQIKASEGDEYAKRLGNEVIDVILPRDEQRALTMFTAGRADPIMMASSNGKAIVFDASELRSQGRRAQGVRGILLDDGATTVSAFPVEGEEVVLLTEHGYVKRMLLSEFRPQGRGGAGLQTCRLADGDRVLAMLPASTDDDLLVIATDGQYLRLPVWQIPAMGRAARGEVLVAPAPGQQLLDARIVPAGAV